jgi:hypothetical protein
MASHGCVNSPNCFCYICGEFMIKNINKTLWASLEKCTMPILVSSWEIKISHGLHTRCRGSEEGPEGSRAIVLHFL